MHITDQDLAFKYILFSEYLKNKHFSDKLWGHCHFPESLPLEIKIVMCLRCGLKENIS